MKLHGKVIENGPKNVTAVIYKGSTVVTKVFFLPSNQSTFTTHKGYVVKAESFISKYLQLKSDKACNIIYIC